MGASGEEPFGKLHRPPRPAELVLHGIRGLADTADTADTGIS